MRNMLIILVLALLSGCLAPADEEFVEVVENEGLTLELVFTGDVRGEPWDDTLIEPYIAAAERWLEVIEGVEGTDHHMVEIFIEVRPMPNGLGAAAPEDIIEIDGNVFPTVGLVEISNFTYSADFEDEYGADANAEFNANILHEMGHVFGIGSLWNLSEEDGEYFDEYNAPNFREWTIESPDNDGPIYTEPAGIAAYNEVFGTNFDFMPVLALTRDHVYSLDDGNEPRNAADGTAIPPADRELMANGRSLSIITIGLLDDLGWRVNYDAADTY